MSDEYGTIINRLRKAIKREDTEKAMVLAKRLIPIHDAFNTGKHRRPGKVYLSNPTHSI